MDKPKPLNQGVTPTLCNYRKPGAARKTWHRWGKKCELFKGKTFTEFSRKHGREEHEIAFVGQIRGGIKQKQMQEKFTYTLINK